MGAGRGPADTAAAVRPEPTADEVARLMAEGQEQREADRAKYGTRGEDAPPRRRPLTPADTGLSWLDDYIPETLDFILEDLLPARVVAELAAEGGTGKSFFLARLFASFATGQAYGLLRPTKPRKVLLLFGEDPPEVVRGRLFDILAAERFNRDLLHDNLHVSSVRGKCGPLLQLDGKGNPAPSEWARWLDDTIAAHPGIEVLGLDPLRMFFGLEENRNEHAHAFVGLLEKVSEEHRILPIFAHHVSKQGRDVETAKVDGRGAGAFSDDCRWVAAMKTVTPDQAERLELDGPHHKFVEFVVRKNNYAARLPAPLFFKRDEHGALQHANVTGQRMQRHAEYLAALLARDGAELTRRQLCKEPAGEGIRRAMESEFKGAWRRNDLPHVLDYGLEHGHLRADTRRKSTGAAFEIIVAQEAP